MGEKSGVTSPEHVRCSGGKTVCGCKARAQTTRDGTARYGWGKEEAVCEGWDHDRSIAASRAFGNGIQRILFGGRTGSVQIRHNAIHYAVCRPLHTLSSPAVNSVYFLKKYSGSTHSHCGAMSYPSYPYSKEKAAQRNSRRVASHSLKRLGERRLGGGERGPFSRRAPPLISSYSTPNSYCPSLSRMAHMVIAIMPERNATRSLGRVSRAPSPTSRW